MPEADHRACTTVVCWRGCPARNSTSPAPGIVVTVPEAIFPPDAHPVIASQLACSATEPLPASSPPAASAALVTVAALLRRRGMARRCLPGIPQPAVSGHVRRRNRCARESTAAAAYHLTHHAKKRHSKQPSAPNGG